MYEIYHMFKFQKYIRKLLSDYRPKHTIFDIVKFAGERSKLGRLAQEGMKTTGGTDVDGIIEHRGGFIVMENKTFRKTGYACQ